MFPYVVLCYRFGMLSTAPDPAAVAAYTKGLAERLKKAGPAMTKGEMLTHLLELTRQVEELAEHLSSSASRQ